MLFGYPIFAEIIIIIIFFFRFKAAIRVVVMRSFFLSQDHFF